MHTVALARYLCQRHHRVSIAQIGRNVYERAESDRAMNTGVVAIKAGEGPGESAWLHWLKVLSAEKADICIFAKGGPFLTNWRIDVLARAAFPRYMTIEHGECPPMPPRSVARHLGGILPGMGLWWWRIFLQRYVRSLAPHLIVCVSHAVREQLVGSYRFSSDKVTTVHDGIDTERFRPSPAHRRKLRNFWRIPEEAFVFGAVGRLSWEKNHALVVELFGQLTAATARSDLHLVIVGDGEMKESLERAIGEAGLGAKVLLAGFHDRPWEVYPAFDALLLTSRNEGLSLALLEAMSSGCCPVAMGVGGVPEIIEDPLLGWLVRPGDSDGFLRSMKEAAESDRNRLEEMGRRARAHVVSHFNAEVQFSKLVELVEKEGGLNG